MNKSAELVVNPTEDDLVVCECGSVFFQNAEMFYKVKSPLIGGPPIMIAAKGGLKCLVCGIITAHDDVLTVKDKGEKC